MLVEKKACSPDDWQMGKKAVFFVHSGNRILSIDRLMSNVRSALRVWVVPVGCGCGQHLTQGIDYLSTRSFSSAGMGAVCRNFHVIKVYAWGIVVITQAFAFHRNRKDQDALPACLYIAPSHGQQYICASERLIVSQIESASFSKCSKDA